MTIATIARSASLNASMHVRAGLHGAADGGGGAMRLHSETEDGWKDAHSLLRRADLRVG